MNYNKILLDPIMTRFWIKWFMYVSDVLDDFNIDDICLYFHFKHLTQFGTVQLMK